MYELPWVEDTAHWEHTPTQRRWDASLADGTSVQATYRTGVTDAGGTGMLMAHGYWRVRIIHAGGTSRMIDYSDSPDREWHWMRANAEQSTRGMVIVAKPNTVNDHVWGLTVGKRLEDAGIAVDNIRAHGMLGEDVLSGQRVASERELAVAARLHR